MSEVIRILVADDHPIVRDGLVAVLTTQRDFAVVGGAGSGAEAVRQVAALAPDVLLLDLAMPDGDGVETLRRLREQGSSVRVIVFTAFDTDERILAAIRAGAQGYLLKGAPREEIFSAIRTTHAGGSLLTPVVASRLLRHVSGATPDGPPTILTPRERQTLQLLGHGLQNKEIAARLGVRERTVKFHIAALMRKLGAGNRTEVVARATQDGLLSLAPHERQER
ncbi:MAG TPA: response regulator transcription factor [Ktedonobacterales bacterium]|jgi:DNA-binding NarL/FixJ family response regulator|nr:response regulator transcription factor [Ktedonobacterales bacterium]